MKGSLELASPSAWWRWARQWRQRQLVESIDRADVLQHVHEGSDLGPRFAFMIVMSAGIATLGLLQGSAAVIIGAMLISPLMGPIVQLGMGLATFELRSIREALRTLLAGVALALAIALPIVWLSPLQDATSEIVARTRPTLFDLLVAILSGLAGAYATVTRKGETIVGVAIATALMPPLAVVGYGIAVGSAAIAGGAGFLFMTNLLAIALSVTIVARWYGFGGSDSPKQSAWQAALIIGTFALLSVPLGLALQRIALQSRTEVAVRTLLDQAAAAASGRVSALRVDADGTDVAVDAVMLLPAHVAGLDDRLQAQLVQSLGQPVTMQLREVLTADDASFAREQGTLAELRRSVGALQDAEAERTNRQRARNDEQAAIQANLIATLGRLQRAADGRRWEWWLAPDTGLSLAQARRLERDATAARPDGAPILVFPPLQALPALPIAGDPAEDGEAREALATQAWALQRWRAGTVSLELGGLDDARAQAWEAAVRQQLQARGLAVGAVERPRGGTGRLQLVLGGA